ncbi:CheR family methyltransferase [Cellulomonas sp. NPDC057328]|uniref:CheR family methyltransferase n=1 Tax=Cellulomonas sp. NPDC057328 TaxID=3346101 RepID=UPI003641D0FE
MDDGPDPQFEALLRHLKEHRGFDFTGYKRQSLVRRVRRRMDDVGADGFEDYQDRLTADPDEYAALFDTVLINVTSFLRDTDAWEYLREQVLPGLLDGGRRLRAWSAGCSTGQEPYTLAMELCDLLGPAAFRDRVKIYATDADEGALRVARAATYAERQVAGLDERRLRAYFERVGDQYVIRKDLRRAVIFGRNDLVQDAPISHVDLLLCRNTLMYLDAPTQAEVVRRLHFALEPGGVLFLGKAEMLLSHTELFQPLELKRRFFRKTGSPPVERRGTRDVPGRPVEPDLDATSVRLRDEALHTAPAAQVVLAADGTLVASNRRADALFGLGARDVGRPFQDLEMSYRPVELRSAVEQATAERRAVWVRDVRWERPTADLLWLDVQVVPLAAADATPLGTTVIFNDVTRHRRLQAELEHANRQLESAYEELQSANEELETMNEELQSTVEELETTNEELQSTNEELETMNEELQSMNDELHASNEELRVRTLEVDELNRFMESVLAGLRVGVAVVDADLRVLAWNSRASDLWGVREDEALGRPLEDLDIGLPVAPLEPLVHAQLRHADGSRTVRVQAVNRRGHAIALDVTSSPLRSAGGRPPGVILLMDVIVPAG